MTSNLLRYIRAAITESLKQGLQIKYFRGDASYYESATLNYLETQGVTYYIRAEKCQNLDDAYRDEVEWNLVKLNHKKVEVCSVYEKVLGKERRVVMYREVKSRKEAKARKGAKTIFCL
ncbi:MAG: hypothetical protein ORN85_10315 [Sediminibacterium sp.]|nr:hypothetical protein [Sediminibacterium sp.]